MLNPFSLAAAAAAAIRHTAYGIRVKLEQRLFLFFLGNSIEKEGIICPPVFTF
jgi:hypothetical protein